MPHPFPGGDRTFFDVDFELPTRKTGFMRFRTLPSRSPELVLARLEKAREVLTRKPGLLHDRNNMGETRLIASILNGEKELVRLLLEHKADPNKIGHVKGELFDRSPLEIALNYNGNPEIVSMLLEYNADPYYRDSVGRTLLMLSGIGCFHQDPPPDPEADTTANFQRMLNYTQDVNQRDNNGNTALHFVRHPVFIPLLCAHGAELNVRGSGGNTPLHRYTDGALALIELFLPFGPDLNVRNEDGQTPLHKVSFYYNSAENVVRLLLAAGADPNIQDNRGVTPLHLAVESLHWEIIPRLVAAGAELNMRDNEGHTPLKMLEGDKAKEDYDWYRPLEPEIAEFLRGAGAHL